MTSTTPSVTFFISARISSLFLVLGMPPTNRRQLSTLAHTPRSLPFLEQQSCFVRSQERGRLKQSPSSVPKHKAKHKASVSAALWDVPVALLGAKAATLLNLTSKSGSAAERKDLREKPKPNFVFPSWDSPFCCHQATAPQTPGPCVVTSISQDLLCSPVACGFPLTS